jgi:hypothetical protein
VTDEPTAPDVGERLVMLGAATTVKLFPALSTPLAWTTTFPVVAPEGTTAKILLALQLITVAVVPLNLIVLIPWVAPKFDPAMVTEAPTAPEVGVKLLILGAGTTVKAIPFVFTPLACTTTFPVVAPEGTVTAMLLALQLVTVAVVPLNLTVPLPWEEPRFDPAMVTAAPTAPVFRERLVMLGVGKTVKLFPLLAAPDTVTTTFPVVAPLGTVTAMLLALQLVTVAVVPLNLTVLLPWVEPKPEPAIVTDAPTAPEVGDRLVIEGAAATTWTLTSKRMIGTKIAWQSFRVLDHMNKPPKPPDGSLGVCRTCEREKPANGPQASLVSEISLTLREPLGALQVQWSQSM